MVLILCEKERYGEFMVILREHPWEEKGGLPSVLGNEGAGRGRGLDGWTENESWEAGIKRGDGPGIAIDIGTTTVVAYLWDFSRREVLRAISQENCQTSMGADVMMRIMHAQRGKGEVLHQMLVDQFQRMLGELLGFWQEAGNTLLPDQEIPVSVVGNPTMCHFFLNQDVSGLAGAPFRSAYEGNFFCTGEELGFQWGRKLRIQVLSGIAAHVGGDALAVLGVAERRGMEGVTLMVDLGTNAEMILANRGSLTCCSTAAGPALEGKGIACGVRAKPGAVTGVKIAPKTGNIVLEYLSGAAPMGITGTGLLELMEGLCRCGILTREGYLLEREEAEKSNIHPKLSARLVTRQGKRGFLLCGEDEASRGNCCMGVGKEIILYQDDVRNVQLAKGAILAGIQCLLYESGLSPEDVEEVLVAGALGNHLREEAVLRLGLFPRAFRGRISLVGNSAGIGAVRMLAESGFAEAMERRAEEIAHVELAEMEAFKKNMMDGMAFREF